MKIYYHNVLILLFLMTVVGCYFGIIWILVYP